MDRFLTLIEAAEMLKVSRMTIYRYVTSGKLPAYKFGRDYRIKAKDMHDFIESKKVEGS